MIRSTKLWVFAAGNGTSFDKMKRSIGSHLLEEPTIHRGKWQTLDVAESPAHATHELQNVVIFYTVPSTYRDLVDDVQPDLPWADEHFLERVSGEPMNPAPSFLRWPHHGGDSARHLDANDPGRQPQFSHTYPERFWPKRANPDEIMWHPNGRQAFVNCGIRYAYGDLDELVGQLVANPLTRQAVLPVWFPEDTGAVDRRVPCSLTYHFMADDDNCLSVWYSLRACDFVRHFHNDVYFAARLLGWVANAVEMRSGLSFSLGEVNMTISSLHAFVGDAQRIET